MQTKVVTDNKALTGNKHVRQIHMYNQVIVCSVHLLKLKDPYFYGKGILVHELLMSEVESTIILLKGRDSTYFNFLLPLFYIR